MEVRPLYYEDIGEDFLATLAALRDTELNPEEARRIYAQAKSFHEWPQMGKVFVAVEEGRVIGVGTLLVEKKFIRGGGIVGHIEDVATHPDWRGKGIGKAIVNTLVREAGAIGCYKIILDCEPHNVEFYRKLGFHESEEKHMRMDL